MIDLELFVRAKALIEIFLVLRYAFIFRSTFFLFAMIKFFNTSSILCFQLTVFF